MTAIAVSPRRRRALDTTAIVYIALVVAIVIGTILVGSVGRNFFSEGNLRAVFTGMSVLGLVAIGQTLVILCGSLDLSVPYVVGLSSLVAAETMNNNPGNIIPAVVLTLAVAIGVGLVSGFVVTGLKVNGFIATLGIGLIIKGYLDTNYKGTAGKTPVEFQALGATYIGPIPISTIIMLALAAAIYVFLTRTRTGARLFAVGGDAGVARLSGVRTQPPVVIAHVLSAVFASLAGMLLAARVSVGSPTVGVEGGYDLLSIAAVVLGGTLLSGGRGSVWGTVGGVAIFAVLSNVMSAIQINPFIQDIVRGAVIIIAVAIYTGRAVNDRRVRFGRKGA